MKLTATVPLAVALMAPSVLAQMAKKPPTNDIKPHLVDNWPWRDPFPETKDSESVEPSCEATKHFFAQEYTLHDLEEDQPYGLKNWAPALKQFFRSREYPGGWSGYDRHGYDRSLLKMNYNDVPVAVREWIENQERNGGDWKGLFGLFKKTTDKKEIIENGIEIGETVDRSEDENKVVIFAPAGIYHTLPLWVAEESDCKETLLDMNRYKAEPVAGNVVGWPNHKLPDMSHKAEFKVTVQVLKEKAVPSKAEGNKEEL